MVKHTPTPWVYRSTASSYISIGIHHQGEYCYDRHKQRCYQAIARLPYPGIAEQKANAQFIVKAVNNYYPMLEALKGLLGAIEFSGWSIYDEKWLTPIQKAKQIIAKAEAL